MKQKPKRERSIILKLFILVLCGYMTITLGGLWKDLAESKNLLKSLMLEQSEKQNEIEELKALLSEDSNTGLIEKAARERLGYIYSDEQVFIDISGN